MPPAALALNSSRVAFDFVREDVLHAHIDGERHDIAGLAATQTRVEPHLKSGDAFAIAIGLGDAQNLQPPRGRRDR